MKKLLASEILYVAAIILISLAFFYKTIFTGLIPVPSDSLVGLYHPWRDYYAAEFPRGMPFKNSLITDPVRQQIPWRKIAIDDLKQGKFPGWNPFSFSGMPLAANIQSGSFYPLNILFLVFNFPVAWTILIMLEPLLSGIFLYLYLRHTGLAKISAFFGSILWMFCGFNVSWLTWGTIVHVSLWAPLVLLSIDKIIESKLGNNRFHWTLIFMFSVFSQFLAGHIQITLYMMLLEVTYAFVRIFKLPNRTLRLKPLIWIFAATIITGFALIIQWQPLWDLTVVSGRLNETDWLKAGWFLPWQNLVQFLVPDFFGNPATLNYWGIWNYGEFIGYIGITGIIFAVSAFFLKNEKAKFWWLLLFVSLLFILPNPISQIVYRLHLPLLSVLQPTRLMVLVDISITVLAAIGFDEITKGKFSALYKSILTVGFIFFMLWLILIGGKFIIHSQSLLDNLAISRRNTLLPFLIFSIIAILLICDRKIHKLSLNHKYIQYLFIIISIFDLFRFGWKFTPFTDRSLFYPQTEVIKFLESQPRPFRIMAIDDRIFAPNTAAYYKIETVSGYDPLYLNRYAEFIAAMERNKPDIQGPFGFNRIIAPKNINSPLFKVLNPKYVISLDPISEAGLTQVIQEGETRLYENKNAMPRVYLVDRVKNVSSKNQAIQALYDSDFDPFQTAVVENFDFSIPNTPTNQADLHLLQYADAELVADINIPETKYLVIGNIFDNGWKARLDGTMNKIYLTNYAFMGVVIPSGHHRLIISYKPNIL